MASPVYSQAFILYTASTPNNSFEVPGGYTAVIRQISVASDISAWYTEVFIQDSMEAPALSIWLAYQAGTANYVSTEGRWVCPPGGIISLIMSDFGSVPSCYVGGYLLGPPPF